MLIYVDAEPVDEEGPLYCCNLLQSQILLGPIRTVEKVWMGWQRDINANYWSSLVWLLKKVLNCRATEIHPKIMKYIMVIFT